MNKAKGQPDSSKLQPNDGCSTERFFNATCPHQIRPKGACAHYHCQALPRMRAARPFQGRVTVHISPPSRSLLHRLTPVFNKDLLPCLLLAFFCLCPWYTVLQLFFGLKSTEILLQMFEEDLEQSIQKAFLQARFSSL